MTTITGHLLTRLPGALGHRPALGERVCVMDASILSTECPDGVRPGAVAVSWGVVIGECQEMVEEWHGSLVYDGPPAPPDVELYCPRPPYTELFRRRHPRAPNYPLAGGGRLWAQISETPKGDPRANSTAHRTPGWNANEETVGYHAFSKILPAGDYLNGYNVRFAGMVLLNVVHIMTGDDAAAQWGAQQLLPGARP
jgi:hypothetical protein